MYCYKELLNFPEGPGYAKICEDVPDEYFPKKRGRRIEGLADPSRRLILINEKRRYPLELYRIHEKNHLENPGLSEYENRLKSDKEYNKKYGIKRGKLVDSAGEYIRELRQVSLENIYHDFIRSIRERIMN